MCTCSIRKYIVNQAVFERTLLIASPLERTHSILSQQQISQQMIEIRLPNHAFSKTRSLCRTTELQCTQIQHLHVSQQAQQTVQISDLYAVQEKCSFGAHWFAMAEVHVLNGSNRTTHILLELACHWLSDDMLTFGWF
jgi:hypothetical protein